MGISWIHQIRAVSSYKMNKFLVVASSLIAAVYGEAEADPALLYGGFGYGLGLPYAYGAYAFGGKSAPCVNAANVPVPCAGAPLAYAGYHGLGYAGLGYAGLGHAVAATPFGLTHSSNVGICTNYLGASVPCGRKKREAEADADAEAAVLYGGYGYPYGLGYHGLGYHGLGYAGLGYAGLGYAYGGVVATNAALGHAVAYTPAGVTPSSNVGVCTNYLGAQVPC